MKSNTSKSNKPMTNYNERLDEILNSEYGVLHCCGDYQEEAKQAILRWVADEVILKPQGRNDKDIGAMSNTAKRTRGNRNELRREQIQTLVQHGYKGANQ